MAIAAATDVTTDDPIMFAMSAFMAVEGAAILEGAGVMMVLETAADCAEAGRGKVSGVQPHAQPKATPRKAVESKNARLKCRCREHHVGLPVATTLGRERGKG